MSTASVIQAVSTTPFFSTALTRSLYKGVSGTDVTSLQKFLIKKNYLAAGNVTGYFGPLTRSAVQKYQCSTLSICSGSEVSTGYGLVGKMTRGKLNGEVNA